MCMHHIVICGISGATVFFHFYVIKAQFLEKKVVEHKMCLLFSLQIFSETFLILTRIEQDVIINVNRYSCKITLIHVRF